MTRGKSKYTHVKASKERYRNTHRDILRAKSEEYNETHKEEHRQYYQNNKERIIANHKIYQINHRDAHKKSVRKWTQKVWKENPEHMKEKNMKWMIENHDRFLELARRHNSKRLHKIIDSIPLNNSFEGCCVHHIDKYHVIHIPERMHQIYHHNLDEPESMIVINWKAYRYLMTEMMGW